LAPNIKKAPRHKYAKGLKKILNKITRIKGFTGFVSSDNPENPDSDNKVRGTHPTLA
jgi:hypothetical protein